MIKISGVYMIKNLFNNKCYIGSSKDVLNRKKCHFRKLNNKRHENYHLQKAWEKYGSENFVFIVLDICDVNDLLINEQFRIDDYNSCERDFGYNISKVAGSPMKDRKHSEEAKRNMSEAKKGMVFTEEHMQKIIESNKKRKGERHSEETKKLISLKNTGKKRTKEMLEKQKKRFSGSKNPSFGTKLMNRNGVYKRVKKEEVKKYLESGWKLGGRKHTEETKEKIRKGNLGKKPSRESVNKMREKLKNMYVGKGNPFYGKHHTEETKEKISKKAKERLSNLKETEKKQ